MVNGVVPSQVWGSTVPVVELSHHALDLSMLVGVLQLQNKTARETDIPEKEFMARFLFYQEVYIFFLAVSYCGYTNACVCKAAV